MKKAKPKREEKSPMKISVRLLEHHALIGITGPGGHTNLVDEPKVGGVYYNAARLAVVCRQPVVPIYIAAPNPEYPGRWSRLRFGVIPQPFEFEMPGLSADSAIRIPHSAFHPVPIV